MSSKHSPSQDGKEVKASKKRSPAIISEGNGGSKLSLYRPTAPIFMAVNSPGASLHLVNCPGDSGPISEIVIENIEKGTEAPGLQNTPKKEPVSASPAPILDSGFARELAAALEDSASQPPYAHRSEYVDAGTQGYGKIRIQQASNASIIHHSLLSFPILVKPAAQLDRLKVQSTSSGHIIYGPDINTQIQISPDGTPDWDHFRTQEIKVDGGKVKCFILPGLCATAPVEIKSRRWSFADLSNMRKNRATKNVTGRLPCSNKVLKRPESTVKRSIAIDNPATSPLTPKPRARPQSIISTISSESAFSPAEGSRKVTRPRPLSVLLSPGDLKDSGERSFFSWLQSQPPSSDMPGVNVNKLREGNEEEGCK
ncbi:hypothetical protein TWF694_011174 [Orbilia ellipsospora]|uniref:Uncharacterized protein n=1 Tax=Orbilia ellipsospora TaxID=2528407 RepID=A0AAV9X8A2_9PEZI